MRSLRYSADGLRASETMRDTEAKWQGQKEVRKARQILVASS